MNSDFNISRFITRTLSVGFALKAITVLVLQQKLESNFENPTFHVGVLLRYLSNIFFFISGFLAFFYEGKYYPRYVKSLYALLLLWIIIVYFRTGGSILDPGSFMGVKGIAPYLGMSVLFSANPLRFQKIMKLLLWLGLVLVIGGFINTLKLGGGFDRVSAQWQLRLIAVNLVWISPLILFFNYKTHKTLSLVIFGFSFIFSLLIVTRSFILIHILVFIFFMKVILKKNIGGIIFGACILLVIGMYLLPNIGVLQQAGTLLSERGDSDSRSLQLFLFLTNIDYNDFILGAGIDSTWIWGSRGAYAWLDNQVLLTAWWAGVVPIFIYLILFIKPMYKFLFKRKVDAQVKSIAFMLFLWVLALLGFAIYASISASFYHFIFCFIMGYLFYLIKFKLQF